MMKKAIAYAMILVFAFQLNVKADEGMWFLAFIGKNYKQMKAMGFKLTPKDIYDINHSSMKDAVVALDHGSCTAELVSPQGLLFTNHHCGYGEIQAHSTVEHDYLTNGFWAKSMKEELPNPGKSVTFLVRMEDVSDKVNAALNDKMSEEEREMTIRKISQQIEKEAIGDTHYEAQVRSLFKGNNFYLFVYETFLDVRLVGAPPSAIGKFGGDTDNWMWPRQTGDFSIFRVYTAPDGSPAEYSPDNVPLKPKHFFPISIKGIKKKDFTMTMGYPGSTSRYLTSWGVDEVMKNENDIRIEVRGAKQEIIKKYMDASDKTRIQYSSKYYRSTNYYKYSIGQNQALKKLNVIATKQEIEKRLTDWINEGDNARKTKYGNTLELIKTAYADRKDLNKYQNYWFESLYLGPEIIGFGLRFRRLEAMIQQAGVEAAKGEAANLKTQVEEFFKDYDPKVDKEVFVRLVGIYKDKVSKDFYPAFFELIDNNYDGSIQKFADELYAKSFLTDKNRAIAFLDSLKADAFQTDLGYLTSKTALDVYFKLMNANKPYDYKLGKGMREFVAGYMQMEAEKNPKKLFYPDANSTIRLSYGKVGGYKVNGKKYNYTTDLESLMAKEDPNNEEFIVPERLKELYKNKDYGRYGHKGKMTVCFISNNDITGGNSGSPVINGNGELIGIAFDGNWEAMSGDIAFDPKLQKCINVDIRYVLFIIDKYAGATNLIDELTIIE